jgi:hypothetical protein
MYEALRKLEAVIAAMWGQHWPNAEIARLAGEAQAATGAAKAKADGK